MGRQNRLRQGLAGFAERVATSLDEFDFDARQPLLRLVVEKVRVSGWRVEIHFKIPLAGDDPGNTEYRPTLRRRPRLQGPAERLPRDPHHARLDCSAFGIGPLNSRAPVRGRGQP